MKTIVQKVAIYCLDDKGRLLVHRHIDYSWEQVGIEAPAGTVKPDENLADAALRELSEETAHSSDHYTIDHYLGSAFYDISPLRNELHERHYYQASLCKTLPERWPAFEEHDGLQTPTRFECFWPERPYWHVLSTGFGQMLWRLT